MTSVALDAGALAEAVGEVGVEGVFEGLVGGDEVMDDAEAAAEGLQAGLVGVELGEVARAGAAGVGGEDLAGF